MKNFESISSVFLLSLVTEKNMSLNTASSYKADLKIFYTFAKQKKLNITTIEKEDIGKFFQNQRKRGFASSTISRRLSAIKQFFKFLVNEGLSDHNPCKDIKNFKIEKKIPGLLYEEDVLRILDTTSIVGKNKLQRVRNKALIKILYASGMR